MKFRAGFALLELATILFVLVVFVSHNTASSAGLSVDLRQNGPIVVSGNLEEGSIVYLTIPVKNYGSSSSPAMHVYTEGYTANGNLWRADNANPAAVVLGPGESVSFTVSHELWVGHVGWWDTSDGVHIWNNDTGGYFGPLNANGYNQNVQFYVSPSSDCADFNYEGVVLFVDALCHGNQLNFSAPSGLTNLTNYAWSDVASSIHVASGWSVMTYEHINGGGASRCVSWSMWDLSQDYFDNSPVNMNDTISSVQVFHSDSCSSGQPDLRQNGNISISGDLVEGGTVYLTIPVKNFGSAPAPAMHVYTEGYTANGDLWRADGADPSAVVLEPGESVAITVHHDLWGGHVGEWNTNGGIHIWNDVSAGYYGPLPSNGFSQNIAFNVAASGDFVKLVQDGQIEVFGYRNEGGIVHLTIPIKNRGNAPSPAIHVYTEGLTAKGYLWRADDAQPPSVILGPGERAEITVKHELWQDNTGLWDTRYGVHVWNNDAATYYGPLDANNYEQNVRFYVLDAEFVIPDCDEVADGICYTHLDEENLYFAKIDINVSGVHVDLAYDPISLEEGVFKSKTLEELVQNDSSVGASGYFVAVNGIAKDGNPLTECIDRENKAAGSVLGIDGQEILTECPDPSHTETACQSIFTSSAVNGINSATIYRMAPEDAGDNWPKMGEYEWLKELAITTKIKEMNPGFVVAYRGLIIDTQKPTGLEDFPEYIPKQGDNNDALRDFRSFIGVSEDGSSVFIGALFEQDLATKDLAKILLAAGASRIILLDSGSSTQFAGMNNDHSFGDNAPFICTPRPIINGIVAYNENKPSRVSFQVPIAGGVFSISPQTTIIFEANTFSNIVNLTYVPKFFNENPLLGATGQFYEIQAYYENGAVAQPSKPYQVIVHYDPDAISNPSTESDLALYFWNGWEWIRDSSSVVDPDSNTITATPNHFSEWAVSRKITRLYMPIISGAFDIVRLPTPTPVSTPPLMQTLPPTSTPFPIQTATVAPTPTHPPTATSIQLPSPTPTTLPTVTPTLPALPEQAELLGPFVNNGGFESGNMSTWTVLNGSVDVNGDDVRSGSYSVYGTTVGDESEGQPPVIFSKDISLSTYSTWINAGLGLTSYEAWLHNGNSEYYRYIVQFYSSSNVQLTNFDTGWVRNPGGGYHWHGEQRAIPVGAAYVHIEAQMKRYSGSYTDVDIDDMAFHIWFNSP